ncbi:MAG TPA: hypothetical protein VMI10_06545 [Terriglobales bacterium]|nr:hypothetical protein [Terriglobales bacterium]
MRSLAVALVLMLAIGVSGFAQKNGGGGKAKAAKDEPKSTAPVKAHQAKGASSGKELQKIEHEKPGKGTHAKRTPAAKVKNTKEAHASGINFNGKGGKGSAVSGRNGGGTLKGRLKEKGKGKKNQ